jgi:hypothetical protein
MRRRVIPLVVGMCGVVAITASAVFAQSAFPVSVDQRVRVKLVNDTTVTGRVSSVTANGFQIAGDDGRPHAANRGEVRTIDVSRGRQSKWKKYAIRGAIYSAAAGAALAIPQRGEIGENGVSAGHAAALGAWSGGLFGGLIGAGIGATRAGDQWETVFP